jgi:hypothetical protein
VFDYLREIQLVGPRHANGRGNGTADPNEAKHNGIAKEAEICVIDADDLLDHPDGIIERFCKSVGEDFDPKMLTWDCDEDQAIAKEAFGKWKGFHEDVIHSKNLKPRAHVRFFSSYLFPIAELS